jgi:hypothetical protein
MPHKRDINSKEIVMLSFARLAVGDRFTFRGDYAVYVKVDADSYMLARGGMTFRGFPDDLVKKA